LIVGKKCQILSSVLNKKANRAQLNHKAFFGGDIDESNEQPICSSQITTTTTTVTKRSMLVKSKSTDNIRTTMTITENGKTKIICPRDQKKVKQNHFPLSLSVSIISQS